MSSYGAKLLFQFRDLELKSNYRLTEERIVVLISRSEKMAIAKANKIGKCAEFIARSPITGRMVSFEYIGIMDIVELLNDLKIEEDCIEAWWDIKKRFRPMERKNKLIKTNAQLLKRI